MTAPDTVIINTLENAVSTDVNRVGGLAGKAVMDALAGIEAGIDSSIAPRDAVRRGLEATPGAGMAVMISAGELLRWNGGIVGVDSSQYTIGRLAADTSVAIAAADPTNPRVDLIYATISTSNEDSFVRNQLTLPARSVAAISFFKTARPRITLTVLTGSPSVSPTFPAVPAGTVGIWYVYVPAATTSIASDYLLDNRRRFYPASASRQHGRENGCYSSTSNANRGNLSLSAGRLHVDGALVDLTSDLSLPNATILDAGVLLPATEYHLYAVARGMAPVGKNNVGGFVPVLTTIPPNADGTPSAAITYRPIQNLGITACVQQTTRALYIGTHHTDADTLFQTGGDGIPLGLDGTTKSTIVDTNGLGGFPWTAAGWMTKPCLTWLSGSSLSLAACAPIIGGVPGSFPGATVTFPGDNVPGTAVVPSSFYYVYLRVAQSLSTTTRGTQRNYVCRISSEAPSADGNKPTPEAGFASYDYSFVGSFYLDGTSVITEFQRRGDLWLVKDRIAPWIIQSTNPALLPLRSTVQALVPSTSRIALVRASMYSLVTAATFGTDQNAFIFAETGRANYLEFIHQGNPSYGAAWSEFSCVSLEVPLSSSGQFQTQLGNPVFGCPITITWSLFQYGYVEAIGSRLL